VPDLAGWRRERMPELPAARPISVRPDCVCEVASPSNRWRDRGRKADSPAPALSGGQFLLSMSRKPWSVVSFRADVE